MVPSRSPAAPDRRRAGLIGLLAVSFTAGAAATAVSLDPGPARAAPFGLDLAALLAGASAAWLARLRGRSLREQLRREQAAPRSRAAAPAGPAGAGQDMQESARRAFVNLARRIQAAVNRQLRELREMEARHGADAEVFGDLLLVDHSTALIGRLADSLAVLGGDRPGRRWHRPIPVIGVLRGAMSRITEYRRVDLGPLPERVAVDGAAVEALVHALAELLDNAARYSPPESRVSLTAYEVGDGLAIEVEDAGVGLGGEAAARAELMLATEDFGFELAALGHTPRLGLAVVGRLARAAGFEASLHRAEHGGVRAVILVPAQLLREPQPQDPSEATAPRSHPHRGAAAATPPVRAVSVTPHGLPQRRRHVPAERPTAPAAPAPPAAAAEPFAVRPGLWLGAFQAGLHGQTPDDARTPENGARP